LNCGLTNIVKPPPHSANCNVFGCSRRVPGIFFCIVGGLRNGYADQFFKILAGGLGVLGTPKARGLGSASVPNFALSSVIGGGRSPPQNPPRCVFGACGSQRSEALSKHKCLLSCSRCGPARHYEI